MTRWTFVFVLAAAAIVAGYFRFFTAYATWWMDIVFVALLAAALIAFIIEWKRVLQTHHESNSSRKQ